MNETVFAFQITVKIMWLDFKAKVNRQFECRLIFIVLQKSNFKNYISINNMK